MLIDRLKRPIFPVTFLVRNEVDAPCTWQILWSNEAHIHLSGTVNTHDCLIWEMSLYFPIYFTSHAESYCLVWIHSLIHHWTYLFEEGMRNGFLICTLTVRRYKNTLEGFVVPLILQRQCLHSIYFMQVSAPPHIELHVFVWYHTLMVEHLIVCFRKSDNLIFETLIPFVLRCVFA